MRMRLSDPFLRFPKRSLMTIRRKVLDDALTLLVLFLATGAFQGLVVDPTDPRAGTEGSPSMQIVWLVVYGAVALRLIPQYRKIMALVRANKCLLLLVLLAVMSVLWSEDPSLTLRRSIALLATTLFGIDFAVRYSVRDQLRLLYIVLGLVVSLGIAAQLLFPNLIPSLDFPPDAWHGVVGFKNDWARIIVLAMVAVLSRSRRSLGDFLLMGSLTLVAFALIALAKSVGGLVILMVMLLLFRVSGALRWRPRMLAAAGLATALVVLPMSYVLFQNFGKATAVVGRDPSLTGRVDIWQLAFSSIARNPIHGYGFSAFWDADSQAATRIREELHWSTPHAHNGYIDMALGLGFAGLFLLNASWLISARRAFDCLKRGAEREAMWPLAYLTFFFLYQFTEGSLVSGNTIFWILYVAVSFSVTPVAVADQPALPSDREFVAPIEMFPLGQERAGLT